MWWRSEAELGARSLQAVGLVAWLVRVGDCGLGGSGRSRADSCTCLWGAAPAAMCPMRQTTVHYWLRR